jgi:3',5'-nucleoside bisphosphate phosphatase
MLKRTSMLTFLFVTFALFQLQAAVREEISFPDIEGYTTITADLHMHTVFSDGTVWPTVRVQEAWRNGLDAISITDHIEYLPHKDDVKPEFNRPYEIAKPEADMQHIHLIRGAEITRDEPHGHFNAVFLEDCNALNVPDQKDAVRIAHEQGAFITWNHPEWKRKGSDVWGTIQQEYFDLGWMHGIEVFNGNTYYKNAHQFAMDKNLTIIGATDIHSPIDEAYNYAQEDHRAMTLIFVSENSLSGIKDALFAKRTVAFANNTLVGREEWVRPIFEASVTIQQPAVTLKGKIPFMVPIHNSSAVSYELKADGRVRGISFPDTITLHAGTTVMLRLQGGGGTLSGEASISLPYQVKNIWTAPDKPLNVIFDFLVTYSE